MSDAKLLAIASGLVLAAGMLRGFSGFGFAIAAVPLLSLVLEPARVVPVVMLLQVLAGLDTTVRAWRQVDWPRIGWLLAGSTVGLLPGLALLIVLTPDAMRLVIATTVALATLSLALGLRFRAMPGRLAVAGVGLFAGLLNGAAAMPGPPVIALYLAAPTPPAVTRASLVFFFLATGAIGAAAAAAQGLIDLDSLILAAVLTPALALGSLLGERVFRLAATRFYRPIALALLAAIAGVAFMQALRGM